MELLEQVLLHLDTLTLLRFQIKSLNGTCPRNLRSVAASYGMLRQREPSSTTPDKTSHQVKLEPSRESIRHDRMANTVYSFGQWQLQRLLQRSHLR